MSCKLLGITLAASVIHHIQCHKWCYSGCVAARLAVFWEQLHDHCLESLNDSEGYSAWFVCVIQCCQVVYALGGTH